MADAVTSSSTVISAYSSYYTSSGTRINGAWSSQTIVGDPPTSANGGTATIHLASINNGATATSDTAGLLGAIVISPGAVGKSLSATSGGAIVDAGYVSGASIANSAAMAVFAGGTGVNPDVAAGGALFVGNVGALSNNITINGYLTSKGVTTSGTGFVSGGTVHVGAEEYIGSGGTDIGSLIQGAQYVSAGGLTISDTVNSGGIQNILSGATTTSTTVGSGGTAVVSSAGIASATKVSGGAVLLNVGAVLNGAVVSAGGEVTVSSGATASGVIVSSGGTEIVQSGGTVSGGTVLKGGEEIVSSGATSLNVTISSGGSLVVAAGASLSGTVVNQGAVIDVDTLSYVSGGTVHLSGNTLTVSEGGSSWSTTLGGTFNSTDYFVLSKDTDGSTIATFVCFCAGTLIRTEDGEEAVENLRIGDRVVTYVDGREVVQPVTWVGHRTAQVRVDLPVDEAGYPVRILKDAISHGVPHKDLLVTPEHCLYFDGRFIPARMLVNGQSIFYDLTMTNYEYFHVETEKHSVLWSDGALSESYLDTGNRREFGQQGGVVRFVTGGARDWSVDAAAPLTVSRELVEPVYRMLESRAAELSLPDQRSPVVLTDDADLHLMTRDGHRINMARKAENGELVFMLPAGIEEVRIVSRASRPSDVIGPMVDDRRHLGILVGEISLWAGSGQTKLTEHMTDENLSGWHAIEVGGARWTNGNALLRLPQRQTLSIAVLSLEVKHAGPYVVVEQEDDAEVIAS